MNTKVKKIDKLSILLNKADKRRNRKRMFSSIDDKANALLTVMDYFESMSASDISIYHKKIVKHVYFRNLPLIKKKSEAQDFYTGNIPDTSLEKSISYMLAAIIERADELNSFLVRELKISSLILMGDFNSAKDEINLIFEEFGHSLWYYTLISTLSDLENDYKSKKEILDPVFENEEHLYFKFMIRNVSSRHDNTGAFLQNITSFKSSLQTFPEKMAEHFIFRLTPLDYSYEYDFESIFNEEKNSCLIDAYKSLVSYVLHRSHLDPKITDTLSKRVITNLSQYTCCPTSKQLLKVVSRNPSWNFEQDEYNILDDYTFSKYEDVCLKIERDPSQTRDFSIFELYTKSLERIDRTIIDCGEIIRDVSSNISSIYKKDNDYVKSYNHLLSLCFSFEGVPWFTSLSLLVMQEDRFSEGLTNLQSLYNLISPLDSPKKSLYLDDQRGEDLIKSALNAFPNSSCLYLYNQIRRDEFISEEMLDDEIRRNKYNAIIYVNRKDFTPAINLLQSSSHNMDKLSENEYSELLGKCLLLSGSTSSAIAFAMDKIINNRSLIPLFNVREMCIRIKDEINSINDIHTPNFLSIYTRYVDDEFKPILRYSLENFFIKNRMLSLDDLFKNKDKFPESQLNYFLEYVCIPDIMKLTVIFHGTKKTETNRIKICSYLVENNKNEAISDELKSLAKSQVLNIATKQVDHSKIYADTSKLRTQDNSGLNELYQQFLKLRAKDYSDNEVERALTKLVHGIVNSKLGEDFVISNMREIYLISQTNNEKNDVFEKILIRIRDEFVFGANGLNINLSTRIRHGHFPSTLRKSLVDENLITTQIKNSSEFKANDFWMSLLKFESEEDYDKADAALKKFSKDYESIISEANEDWFQVKIFTESFNKLIDGEVKSKRLALFDFSITVFEAFYIQSIYASYSSYAEFMKSVIDWLWKKTDHNLINIRNEINTTLRAKVYSVIRSLQQDIHEIIMDENVTHEFNNAIGRCKESLNINLEIISSWFMRSEQIEITSYDFDTVVEIARRAADTSVTSEMPSNLKLKGKTLSSFVDVLYMIFENAKTKSSLRKDEVNIKISLKNNEDGSADLSITNTCKTVESISDENLDLEIYKEKYYSYHDYLTFAQGEGNTGLIKIAKILYQDLELDHDMIIGYKAQDKFEIKFKFHDFYKVIDNADTHS